MDFLGRLGEWTEIFNRSRCAMAARGVYAVAVAAIVDSCASGVSNQLEEELVKERSRN
jgi:hypothetical protein